MKHLLVPYTFKLDEDRVIGDNKRSPEFKTHVDKKFIKYDPTKDSTKEKTSKVCIGLGVLIASYVLFLSNKPVDFKLGIYYFVVGLFATIVLPWIFKTINNQPAKTGEKNDVKTEEKGE